MSSSDVGSAGTTTDSISTADLVYDVLGFAGGIFLVLSQLPQIYRVHKRKSTKDISYGYQGIYSTSCTLFSIYYGYFEYWAVFIPCVVLLCLIVYLFGVKIYFEEIAPRRAAPVNGRNGSGLGSALLSGTQGRSDEGGQVSAM